MSNNRKIAIVGNDNPNHDIFFIEIKNQPEEELLILLIDSFKKTEDTDPELGIYSQMYLCCIVDNVTWYRNNKVSLKEWLYNDLSLPWDKPESEFMKTLNLIIKSSLDW